MVILSPLMDDEMCLQIESNNPCLLITSANGVFAAAPEDHWSCETERV